MPVRRILFWMGGVWAVVAACLSSCAAGQKAQGLTPEAQRRFDYYYAEAVKSSLAGRYDDAFALYSHCLDINPDAGEALFNLSLYYLEMDDSAKCAESLTRAVALQPDNVYYKEVLASFFLRNRDNEHAVPVLEDMVERAPARSDVLAQLVNIYMERVSANEMQRAFAVDGCPGHESVGDIVPEPELTLDDVAAYDLEKHLHVRQDGLGDGRVGTGPFPVEDPQDVRRHATGIAA